MVNAGMVPAGHGWEPPTFFRRPQLLCGNRHRRFGLLENGRYAFAARFSGIPIGVSEFTSAQRHYPIVFTGTAVQVPVVVTGLSGEENLFVTGQGDWQPGCYVPGLLRQYPFTLQPSADVESASLMVDEDCPRFVDARVNASARRLFDDEGEPSPLAQEMLGLCHAALAEAARTAMFTQALQARRLLPERSIDIRFQDGTRHAVAGCRMIDADAFLRLPRDVVVDWHGRGWLHAISLHLASQQNWSILVEMHAQHRAEGRRPDGEAGRNRPHDA